MLETLLVTFREGVEAFLIVAILSGYLVQSGRTYLLKAVAVAIVCSLILSYALGNFLADFDHMELFEGTLAIVSALLVGTLTLYVHKNSWRFAKDIKKKVDYASEQTIYKQYALVFLFTLLMVSREGVEVSLLLSVISYEAEATDMYIGAAIGVAAAALLGFLWVRYNSFINLKLFMKVTTVFLLLFTLHLLVYGFHEFTEVSAVPFIDNDFWHIATEDFEGNGIYGKLITYFFVAFPFVFLAYSAYDNAFQLPQKKDSKIAV